MFFAEQEMRGAARHLRDGGRLLLYGPYRVDGVATAPSNEAFDARLREDDPQRGIRDLEAVLAAARGDTVFTEVALSEGERAMVFHGNAERLLRIGAHARRKAA